MFIIILEKIEKGQSIFLNSAQIFSSRCFLQLSKQEIRKEREKEAQ